MLDKYSDTGLDLTFSRVSPLMSNVGKEKMSDFEDLTRNRSSPYAQQ